MWNDDKRVNLFSVSQISKHFVHILSHLIFTIPMWTGIIVLILHKRNLTTLIRFPQKLTLRQDSTASNLYESWSQETLTGSEEWDREWKKANKKCICKAFSNLVTGARSCWGTLKNGVKHNSVSPTKGQRSWHIFPPATLSIFGWSWPPEITTLGCFRLPFL